ncbi:hypothetical protein GCM10027586_02980 [Kineococcus gypseus]|uniref:hypothetical protein n=1 Tax=Kineococcus gypseus TaxID=1637102 RepID=UPI003D7DC60E
MSEQLWAPRRSPHELGVIAHGPLVLARAEGIAAALRCVFAHPDGLHLPLVLRADVARAGDLARWSYGTVRRFRSSAGRQQNEEDGALSYSAPELIAHVNGRSGLLATTGPLHAGDEEGEGTGRGGAHVHGLDASYWIGELPHDGVLELGFAWPQAGLAPTSTTVRLAGLEDLAERVVPLP